MVDYVLSKKEIEGKMNKLIIAYSFIITLAFIFIYIDNECGSSIIHENYKRIDFLESKYKDMEYYDLRKFTDEDIQELILHRKYFSI